MYSHPKFDPKLLFDFAKKNDFAGYSKYLNLDKLTLTPEEKLNDIKFSLYLIAEELKKENNKPDIDPRFISTITSYFCSLLEKTNSNSSKNLLSTNIFHFLSNLNAIYSSIAKFEETGNQQYDVESRLEKDLLLGLLLKLFEQKPDTKTILYCFYHLAEISKQGRIISFYGEISDANVLSDVLKRKDYTSKQIQYLIQNVSILYKNNIFKDKILIKIINNLIKSFIDSTTSITEISIMLRGLADLSKKMLIDVSEIKNIIEKIFILQDPNNNSASDGFTKQLPMLINSIGLLLESNPASKNEEDMRMFNQLINIINPQQVISPFDIANIFSGISQIFYGRPQLLEDNAQLMDQLLNSFFENFHDAKIQEVSKMAKSIFLLNLTIDDKQLEQLNHALKTGYCAKPSTLQTNIFNKIHSLHDNNLECHMEHIIGAWPVDIYIEIKANPPVKLVIELDGNHHYDSNDNLRSIDEKRDEYLQQNGYHILRFKMPLDLDMVIKEIKTYKPQEQNENFQMVSRQKNQKKISYDVNESEDNAKPKLGFFSRTSQLSDDSVKKSRSNNSKKL